MIRKERKKIKCKKILTEAPDFVISTVEVKRLAEVNLTVNVSSSLYL